MKWVQVNKSVDKYLFEKKTKRINFMSRATYENMFFRIEASTVCIQMKQNWIFSSILKIFTFDVIAIKQF